MELVLNKSDGGVSLMLFIYHTDTDGKKYFLPNVLMVPGKEYSEDELSGKVLIDRDFQEYVLRQWQESENKNAAAENRQALTIISWRELREEERPADKSFREAWRHDGDKVYVCIDKARDIHMSRIREARNARLTELDKRKYGAEHDAERQALRDIPQTFDLTPAQTPEELKTLWPENLERI